MESLFTVFPDSTTVDPNMFAMQWDVLIEVLVLIIVVSFIVERFLAVLFETKYWLKWSHERREKDGSGTGKPMIAFIFSFVVCVLFQIDLMAVLMSHQYVSLIGEAITGGVIAGGSKASIKLFKEILGVKKQYTDAKAGANNE